VGDLVTKDPKKAKVLDATVFLVCVVGPALGNHSPLRLAARLEQGGLPWWRRNESSAFNTMTAKHFTWDCRIQVGLFSDVLTKR